MNPVISITRIEIEVLPHHGSTLIVTLENVGHRPVGPGSLVAKRISKDGVGRGSGAPVPDRFSPW